MPATPEPSLLPSLLTLLVFGGAAVAFFIWNQRRLARRGVLASQSFREFLEQTGFRVVGAERADLGQQAELALRALGQEGGESGQEWVRECGGVEVRHFSDPFRENILAALGGATGLMLMGYDPRAMTQMMLPVHDRVSWLAASLARACA